MSDDLADVRDNSDGTVSANDALMLAEGVHRERLEAGFRRHREGSRGGRQVKVTKTDRGFEVARFVDLYGAKCSIQRSSIATTDAIWFGCDEIGLKRFTPFAGGWQDVALEQTVGGVHHVANNRMHLTRDMVRELLPVLQRFVDTGELEAGK